MSSVGSAQDELIGDDHTHWNVVGLRMNRRQLRIRVSYPDGMRAGRSNGQCSVVEPTSVPQSIVRAVEPDQRDDQHVRLDHLANQWNRYVPRAPAHRDARPPPPKFYGCGIADDDRQCHNTTGFNVSSRDLAQIDLATDGPVESQDGTGADLD